MAKAEQKGNQQRRDLRVKLRQRTLTLEVADGETMPEFITRARAALIEDLDEHLTVDVQYNNSRQQHEARVCHAAGIAAGPEARQEAAERLLADTKEDPAALAAALGPILHGTVRPGEAKPAAPKAGKPKAKRGEHDAHVERLVKASARARSADKAGG